MRTAPSPGPVPLGGRVRRRALPWLVCAALLAGGAGGPAQPVAAAEPAPTVSVDTQTSVKYYIVGHTGTPEREYLFDIAARTLGDGRRYIEIFELNKGRVQPDGQRMEDPLVLMPGWVLILPDDADGPGVQFGPPPVFGSANAPKPPATGGASASPSSGDGVLRAVALVIVMAILAVSLHLLRRGRRIELPKLARAGAPAALEAPRRPALPASTGGTDDHQNWISQLALTQPATVPARDRVPPRALTGPDQSAPPPTTPSPAGLTQPAPPPTTPPPTTPSPTGLPPAQRPPTPRTTPANPVETPVLDRPAKAPKVENPVDPATTRVELRLRSGADRLTVRLLGVRPDMSAGFLTRGEAGPRGHGGAVVQLGNSGPDAVWLDLLASPDVVTLTGDPAKAGRQAQDIARQLSRAGVSTVAVGSVPSVAGVVSRSVASLAELADAFAGTQPLVVFVGALTPGDLAALPDLVVRRQPRVVPIAVGPTRRARWSIDVA